MSAEQTPAPDKAARLLRRLYKGMERRPSLSGAGRSELDAELVSILDGLFQSFRFPVVESLDTPPPRPIAIAMATAVLSQPHLSVFADLAMDGTDDVTIVPVPPGDAPFVVTNDVLQEALGLAQWELEDIREDVDRRVGAALKQARALWWLWSHFGLPRQNVDQLFRVLVPGTWDAGGPRGMVARGPYLYALARQGKPPPLESLYLTWLPVDEEKTLHPRRTFSSRYVPPSLRKGIARAIGASVEEVGELLDQMVAVLPRDGTGLYFHEDLWRTRGFATLCGMPTATADPAWLVRELEPDEVVLTGFIRRVDDGIAIRDPRAAFDSLAVPRVNEVARQLYASMLAELNLEDAERSAQQSDLLFFDVERHLKTVLKPLVAWAESPRTAGWLAAQFQVSSERITRALDEMAVAWKAHMDSAWVGGPRDGQPRTVQMMLTTHLIASQNSVRALLTRPVDARGPHRDLVLLFAANLFAGSPLEFLLADAADRSSPIRQRHTDAVGYWFWDAWQRILARRDDETLEL